MDKLQQTSREGFHEHAVSILFEITFNVVEKSDNVITMVQNSKIPIVIENFKV